MRCVACLALVAAGGCAAACASFASSAEPTIPGDAGAETGTVPDGAAAAGPPFCTTTIAKEVSEFTTGKAVFGFDEETSDGGTLGWSGSQGAKAQGSLEAKTTGAGYAQIVRDFPIQGATRARLAFALDVKSVGPSGNAYIGCTLQVTSRTADGGAPWSAIDFRVKDGTMRFDQDSNGGGPSIESIVIADVRRDKWIPIVLEMTDLTSSSVRYRAVFDGRDVTPGVAVIMLQGPPDHFHIKCGIDDTEIAVHVLTDDFSFETCVAP